MTARRMRTIVYCLISAALVTVATACGSAGPGSGSGSGAGSGSGGSGGHITLGVAAGNGPANADLAQALGYFKDAGLDVSFKPLNGAGAEAIAGLDSGSITIVESNVVSVMQSAQHGIKAPCFTGGVDFANNMNSVLESAKSITQPSQLAGKSIGVISTNSANTLMIDAYLAAHGVDYHSVHFVATGVTNTLSALQSGSVQAGELVAPYSQQYLQSGGNLLQENFGTVVNTPIFACWTALKDWLNSNSATAKKFVQALDRADTYYYAHPKQAAAMVSKLNGLPPSANSPDMTFKFTTSISGPQLQQWITLGQKYGVLHDVNLSQVYDPIGG
ncbi:MAG: ABC transporter substrate-binding protein [Actinobacteria bacterium]|nr:ABC transporter substrate-binding protein [Actinomycetota bacterium]